MQSLVIMLRKRNDINLRKIILGKMFITHTQKLANKYVGEV